MFADVISASRDTSIGFVAGLDPKETLSGVRRVRHCSAFVYFIPDIIVGTDHGRVDEFALIALSRMVDDAFPAGAFFLAFAALRRHTFRPCQLRAGGVPACRLASNGATRNCRVCPVQKRMIVWAELAKTALFQNFHPPWIRAAMRRLQFRHALDSEVRSLGPDERQPILGRGCAGKLAVLDADRRRGG